GWDPIEVQSLVSWLIYAIWLHLRLTFGWRGHKLAWYSLLSLIIIGTNMTGVPFIEKAFHSGFRIQH
ncbi:MAG TPA: cytochrome C biogenesis protein, partial [Elusimicrobia bacterium]|nr:cytochrome C biogenesis protein [Elusimicrobiota bacterium]